MFSSNGSQVASSAANYIEDVFSTYPYTGNSSTQTITNGIDLAGKGGLVWIKGRSGTYGAESHNLTDTARGTGFVLFSNATNAQFANTDRVTAFNSDGFSLGSSTQTNGSSTNIASWTFRKQPKFFDVVTYTGDGTNPRQIAHNLGSVPGCIIVKSTTRAENWTVYHTSLGNAARMALNTTAAVTTGTGVWASTTPTSTYFTVSADNLVNFSGDGYVAYLFAHNAGGFGLTGTDNVISCGSYTGTGAAGNVITLGYEPQWILSKASTSAQYWQMFDVMRGMSVGSNNDAGLYPNVSNTEAVNENGFSPTATGFVTDGSNNNLNGVVYIYIAIRRGPMKVPTDGTKVFAPVAVRNASKPGYTSGFPVDFAMRLYRPGGGNNRVGSRLTGATHLETNTTAIEASDTEMTWDYMNGWGNDTGATSVLASQMFRRAPSFFDEVCYTGTGGTQTLTHNLTVTPELAIVKTRSTTSNWAVAQYSADVGLYLDSNIAAYGNASSSSIRVPTATTINVANTICNATAETFVAYLFATCPGVSKVGSYTGTGTTQQINCGFTAGTRFVLIKRTDSTGDWYVWDTARGIVSGNDPYLLLNSTAAEVTSTDYVDPYSAGFELSTTALTTVNVLGGSYIYLAIA